MMAPLAAILTLARATLLYLAAPHQKLARHSGGKPAAITGAVLLAAALVALLHLLGPATAVFAWATGTMLVWSIVPLAAAWWRGAPEDQR